MGAVYNKPQRTRASGAMADRLGELFGSDDDEAGGRPAAAAPAAAASEAASGPPPPLRAGHPCRAPAQHAPVVGRAARSSSAAAPQRAGGGALSAAADEARTGTNAEATMLEMSGFDATRTAARRSFRKRRAQPAASIS